MHTRLTGRHAGRYTNKYAANHTHIHIYIHEYIATHTSRARRLAYSQPARGTHIHKYGRRRNREAGTLAGWLTG